MGINASRFGNRRGGGQAGESKVELALVLLPFLALMLAIVDFSMPIFLRSLFTYAVREGCRFGITHQTTFNGTLYASQTLAIKAVVQTNAMGFLAGTTGANQIAINYYAGSSPFGAVTGTGSNAPGNIVEVSVTGYSWLWIAPLWRVSTPLTISAISSDRLEPLAAGALPPAP